VTADSRGGQRAALPAAGWKPPARAVTTAAGGAQARFIEELSGQAATFDFSGFPVAPAVQEWLARAFTRSTGPRSGAKRVSTASNRYYALKGFAESLASARPPVQRPGQLGARHVVAFRAGYDGRPGLRWALTGLRSALRDDPDLPEAARAELYETRLPEAHEPVLVTAYSDQEWQVIMTALRHDVRGARDRIRAGQDLLGRYRLGQVAAEDAEHAPGRLLDEFDQTGDLPRYPSGTHTEAVLGLGGFTAIAGRLCMTQRETTAFCLLLAALTGENAGTVAGWPAVFQRPGGAAPPGVVLIEESKPRRGPEREHMVAALEDTAPALAGLLDSPGEEHRLFRSPLRVYLLLLDLGEVARRHSGTGSPFTALAPGGGGVAGRWATRVHVVRWARAHGFPAAHQAAPGSRPAVDVRRIRQTVTEQRRQPVAHTRQTMNDHYLARSRGVQAESRVVVGTALRGQVEAARARQKIPVLTAGLLARARGDLPGAAAEAGLEPEVLARMIAGGQDTALAACADHLAGPHAPAGVPCPASFLSCLDCANARALPRHLPVQVAVADRMAALRPHLDPAVWAARYGPRLGQLAGIIGAYTAAEQEQARRALDERQRRLVDDLMGGRLDLR
jgi:hypothetical protein